MARVVPDAMALSLRGIENRLDSPAQSRGGFRLLVPQRLKHGKNRFGAYLVHRSGPQRRRGFHKSNSPLVAVLFVAPFTRLGLKQGVGDLAECWLARADARRLAPRLNGIATRSEDSTGLVARGASFCEPNAIGDGTEAHLRPPPLP
jgi:hypothetical protein